MRFRSFFVSFVLFLFTISSFGQDDKKVLGEVTVYAKDPVYQGLRTLSTTPDAFSGPYATVNNLVLKKDAAVFILKSGEIYFLKPTADRTTGAVFIGSGEFALTPPVDVERKHLAIFTGAPEIKEPFNTLTMFFTDETFDEIKSSSSVKMGTGGAQADKARSEFRSKERTLRDTFRYNISARVLGDIYAPQRKGFFTVFIEGEKFGKLLYGIDPLGHEEVYPEQVQLISYGTTTGGIWTAFHMQEEYKKGTAVSWADPRPYDIKHHDLDTTIDGTRLKVTDEITLEMREANSRLLPFDLYRTLRVRAVTNEAGSALDFIQEKKDEDADLFVILPAAKEVGKSFKIKIEYEGADALREEGTGNFILIPRSTWYPNNPHTSFGDRATFDLTFRYPKKHALIGVGSRIGEPTTEKDVTVSKWSSEGTELAVAGFNYGGFKMKQLQDASTNLTLEVFTNNVLPSEMLGLQQRIDMIESSGALTETTLGSLNTGGMATTVLNEAQNSTRIYQMYFGKLPFKRIAMTQQPAGFFGQAWPTLVYMPYTAFFSDTHRVQLFGIRGGTDGFWREVAAHEVAHQWWGHAVGWTSYRDQWMSEGFSEFSTSLFIQYVKKDVNKLIEFWDDQRKRIIEASPRTLGRKPFTVGPVTQGYRLNSAKTGAVAQSMIYPKGAFILHMIRMMMYDHKRGTGDQRFQKMMQEFVASNFNKDVSTNDFKLAVEKHMLPVMDIDKNGKMDWFFDQWVYGTDVPSYKLEYSLKPAGGRTTMSVKLTQSGVADDFVMLVPLYMDLGKGPAYLGTATVVGNSSVDLNNVSVPGTPKNLKVAALHDVLTEKVEVIQQ